MASVVSSAISALAFQLQHFSAVSSVAKHGGRGCSKKGAFHRKGGMAARLSDQVRASLRPFGNSADSFTRAKLMVCQDWSVGNLLAYAKGFLMPWNMIYLTVAALSHFYTVHSLPLPTNALTLPLLCVQRLLNSTGAKSLSSVG